MAKTSLKDKNSPPENILVAQFVVVHTLFLKNTVFAEFVLENLHLKEKFLVLRRLVGKEE